MSLISNTSFFFYKNFVKSENLNKISTNYTISDGSINVYDYSNDMNRICFSKNNSKNSLILNGKIVNFQLSNKEILMRIGKIKECKLSKKIYTMSLINVNKHNNQSILCYIIY